MNIDNLVNIAIAITHAQETISLASCRDTELSRRAYLKSIFGDDDITDELRADDLEGMPLLLSAKDIIEKSVAEFIESDKYAIDLVRSHFKNDAAGNDHLKFQFTFKSSIGTCKVSIVTVISRDCDGWEHNISSYNTESFIVNDVPMENTWSQMFDLFSDKVIELSEEEDTHLAFPDELAVQEANETIAKYAPLINMANGYKVTES